MKHPIHTRIVELINSNRLSREQISEALGFSPRTLIRRCESGEWTLPEILKLESMFKQDIIFNGDKNVFIEHGQNWQLNDNPEPYNRKKFKISIQLDPNDFQPQDMEALNKELSETLAKDFKDLHG